jgi:hypothetical protein
MKELRRQTETPGNNATPSQPGTQPSGGDGVSHHKDGGSKLNPNEAPQQTVNPPNTLWSGDTMEAAFELPSSTNERNIDSVTGESTHIPFPRHLDRVAVTAANRAETRTQAKIEGTPERSKSCLA